MTVQSSPPIYMAGNLWTRVQEGFANGKRHKKLHRMPSKDFFSTQGFINPEVMTPENFLKLCVSNPDVAEKLHHFFELRQDQIDRVVGSPEYQEADDQKQVQMILEATAIGIGKIAQILADNESISPELRSFFKNFKSNGTPTRTLGQTQRLVDQLYGNGQYELESLLGVGTIAESYRAFSQSQDGKALKILKDGVNSESLEAERQLVKALISAFADPMRKEMVLRSIDRLYEGWQEELDFSHEAQAARDLSCKARRFRVAQPVAEGVAPDGQVISVVYDMAQGIEMAKLIELIQLYKKSPREYAASQKVLSLRSRYPWLKNPSEWMDKLPKAFIQAYNEQIMIPSRKGRRVHGDPHGGNMFVDVQNGKPLITFIDTGLTYWKTQNDILDELGLTLSFMTGNAEALAEKLANLSEPVIPAIDKEEAIPAIAYHLRKELFRSGSSLLDAKQNFELICTILRNYGLELSPGHAIKFKASIQAQNTYKAIAEAAGIQPNPIQDSLSDIFRGLVKIAGTNPLKTGREILPLLRHCYRQPGEASAALGQFVPRKDSSASGSYGNVGLTA